jgi:hypothetical protein
MTAFSRLFSLFGRKDQGSTSTTIKELLIAREPPWGHVPKIVTDEIVKSITDKGLLEAFVMQSMNAGLVAKYERLDGDPKFIRARISQILCLTGNRAVPELMDAMMSGQEDAGLKALALAADTFEAAIALAPDQMAAYIGLAQIYRLLGKTAKSQNYAKQGLLELEKSRAHPAWKGLKNNTFLPPDMDTQIEQQLRSYLAEQPQQTKEKPNAWVGAVVSASKTLATNKSEMEAYLYAIKDQQKLYGADTSDLDQLSSQLENANDLQEFLKPITEPKPQTAP